MGRRWRRSKCSGSTVSPQMPTACSSDRAVGGLWLDATASSRMLARRRAWAYRLLRQCRPSRRQYHRHPPLRLCIHHAYHRRCHHRCRCRHCHRHHRRRSPFGQSSLVRSTAASRVAARASLTAVGVMGLMSVAQFEPTSQFVCPLPPFRQNRVMTMSRYTAGAILAALARRMW